MLIFLLSAVSILLVGGGIAVLQSGGIAVPGSLHCYVLLFVACSFLCYLLLKVGGRIAVVSRCEAPPLLLVVETANCPILSSANINPQDDFHFAHRHFERIKLVILTQTLLLYCVAIL